MWPQLLYRLKRPWHFFKTGLAGGLRAEIKHGFPARRLKIIGITGTDGKTTTATLVYHILQHANIEAGLVSTVGAYLGRKQLDTGFHVTSPNPGDLQRLLRDMLNQGITYVVLEVTSHGLYQHRLWGVEPIMAGVTNVDQEHLDYHLTYRQYLQAKALLLKNSQLAILNADDQSFQQLKQLVKRRPMISYSLSDNLAPELNQAISQRFPERFNRSNARLAASIADQLGIAPTKVAQAIESFAGVPGRMENVPTKRQLRVVVDFAHTPQGLAASLTSLREQLKNQRQPGRLIAVYGSAGLRDRRKRPAMGKIGAELADLVVLTAEDPRTENTWSIIRQMKEGVRHHHRKLVSIADRRRAIEYAINELAKPGDLVAILGKGHEQSMCYGTTELPWDDRQVAQTALERKEAHDSAF